MRVQLTHIAARHGHRSVDPKTFEIKTERITHNGKTYNVYPDRT
jgi:hypothetical protein